MKITQFNLTLGFGGAEAVIRDYALELKRRGHEVEVLVLFPLLKNDNEKKLEEAGIKVRSIYEEIFLINTNTFFFRVLRKPYRTLLVRKWIGKYIDREKPDVFHCHLEVLRYLVPGTFSRNNTKLFFTCHNESSYYFGNPDSVEVKSAKKLFLYDDLHMFALHERMKNELNDIFSVNNTEVMNNPIQLSRFLNPQKDIDEVKKEFQINKDDLIIGHVGRFFDQKNHDFLIDVFDEISKRNEKAKLLLVGDGPLKSAVEQKCEKLGIRSKVIFAGVRNDVPELMSCMDKFVFPSKFEGLGIVLIEAQSVVPMVFASDKVPSEVAVTSKLSFIPLEKSAEYWAKVILEKEEPASVSIDKISDYDVTNVVSRLESFYAG